MVRATRQKAAAPGAADPAAEAEQWLARVRALAPSIEAAAETTERTQRVPEPLQTALLDTGFFRMLVPRSIGGAEVHPLTFMRVVEAIAAIDASPAWNIGQNAVCGLIAAYLEPAVAKEVFGDPRAVLAWGPPDPGTEAVAVEGGYRVSGSWSFASGGRHATWLGAYSTIQEADGTFRQNAEGGVVRRVLLVPAAEVEMRAIWDVIGLRGTASDAFSVKERFVPEAYTVNRDDLGEVREPGWLYAFKTTNLYSCGFAAIALGVARSLLDAFTDLAREKTPRGYRTTLRENSASQSDLAEAEAQWRAARAYLYQTVTDVCTETMETRALSLEQRVAIRLASTHTIRTATRVGDFAYEAAGATAVFRSSPFERRFRDLHTIAQQVQGRKSNFQTVGAYLMGEDVDLLFL